MLMKNERNEALCQVNIRVIFKGRVLICKFSRIKGVGNPNIVSDMRHESRHMEG